MNTINKKSFKKLFPDITFVSKQFSKYFFQETFIFQWGSVVYISLIYAKIDDFTFVINDNVEFETIKPANG